MKVPGIVAVMVLGAASMWAQAAAAPAAQAPAAPATAAAPDAGKPANHAACKHEMSTNGGAKKTCHCMKNKDGNMAKDMDGKSKGSCPRMKTGAENKS
jgi:hypothetical protein